MSRAIDADALIAEFDSYIRFNKKVECYTNLFYADAATALKKTIQEAPTIEQPKWISVAEALPDGECLAISMKPGLSYKEQWIGYVSFDGDYGEYVCENDGIFLSRVTHWMPLPQPPKEGE